MFFNASVRYFLLFARVSDWDMSNDKGLVLFCSGVYSLLPHLRNLCTKLYLGIQHVPDEAFSHIPTSSNLVQHLIHVSTGAQICQRSQWQTRSWHFDTATGIYQYYHTTTFSQQSNIPHSGRWCSFRKRTLHRRWPCLRKQQCCQQHLHVWWWVRLISHDKRGGSSAT
jgi:hypothetical protein